MAINLNQPAQAGFDQPIELLMDCHRRIEKFLAMLLRVTRDLQGGPMEQQYRDAASAALRYFRNAAPWHTDDEEVSLFPRLRELDDQEVAQVLDEVAKLEADHAQATVKHDRVEVIMTQWLEQDHLPPALVEELLAELEALEATYQRHIAQEDQVVFPLAAKVLDGQALRSLGKEMAQRRGLDTTDSNPQPRCRHAKANREAAAAVEAQQGESKPEAS